MSGRQNREANAPSNLSSGLSTCAQPFDYARFHFIGTSPAFLGAMRILERLTACDATVLVQGETGTGKELAARAIHYLGRRRDSPFVPVNCGAIPEALIESELFGHVRGAFTDAREPHIGLVAQAQGGTLFLDEIETLSARAQIALLRFLQEREYRPVGGQLVRGANVRIISASNADLAAIVDTGRFRADLLFRLDVLAVSLPPLRDRDHDAVLLAQAFTERYCHHYDRTPMALAAGVSDWLVAQRWPGNVRELENLVHRAVVLSDGPTLDFRPESKRREHNPACSVNALTDCSFREAKTRAIANFEREYIIELLSRAHGNLSLAARVSGKERSRLGRLLKKYGLTRDSFTPARVAPNSAASLSVP
jgi:two-component system, NtrC family, response regulator GlrR